MRARRGTARRERRRARRAARGAHLARAALLLLLLLLGGHPLQAALGRGGGRALQLALLRLLGGSYEQRARGASVNIQRALNATRGEANAENRGMQPSSPGRQSGRMRAESRAEPRKGALAVRTHRERPTLFAERWLDVAEGEDCRGERGAMLGQRRRGHDIRVIIPRASKGGFQNCAARATPLGKAPLAKGQKGTALTEGLA